MYECKCVCACMSADACLIQLFLDNVRLDNVFCSKPHVS